MIQPRGLHWSSVARLLRARTQSQASPVHVFICIADHYEPKWAGAAPAVQRERVERWLRDYPVMARDMSDSRGRAPQHTYFYPAEEYEAEYLDLLAELCRAGYGEVEIHLHHDNDTSDGVRETLEVFKAQLHDRHGLLQRNADGQVTYGFVHGNWALDNSRPDGRWCGVNDEISILLETGCYADFTMPSAPDPAQTRTINSIYYATDDRCRPKSHDHGVRAEVGKTPPANSLLMVQGPLAFDWQRRKWGLLPRLENGDLHGRRPPDWSRFELWRGANICVAGRPDWLFIKLHTHGAQEGNAAMLLGDDMRRFHAALARHARDEAGFRYYYVTAREMAALVHQAEDGQREPLFDGLAFLNCR